VPLENKEKNELVGTHLEKLAFGDELMVSDRVITPKFSKISLAVGKDSGWYEIDLNLADLYTWGKEKGCEYFSGTCPVNLPEFCDQIESKSCSEDHLYVTECAKSQYTESCGINKNLYSCKLHHSVKDDRFYFGEDSVCLKSEVSIL